MSGSGSGVGGCQEASESVQRELGWLSVSDLIGPRARTSPSFADASASGNDVFFFTDQPLVGQDQDSLVDVYDARVGGGIAAQSPSVTGGAVQRRCVQGPGGCRHLCSVRR